MTATYARTRPVLNRNVWEGDVCVVTHGARWNGWSHGVVVKVTTTPRGRVTWVRLRFPNHDERSFRPHELLKAIP